MINPLVNCFKWNFLFVYLATLSANHLFEISGIDKLAAGNGKWKIPDRDNQVQHGIVVFASAVKAVVSYCM
jgi:uncharacterized membrane protein YsdA (DUF1294 family)